MWRAEEIDDIDPDDLPVWMPPGRIRTMSEVYFEVVTMATDLALAGRVAAAALREFFDC